MGKGQREWKQKTARSHCHLDDAGKILYELHETLSENNAEDKDTIILALQGIATVQDLVEEIYKNLWETVPSSWEAARNI